jgi:tetratricopeptide (TPR) repeat protein
VPIAQRVVVGLLSLSVSALSILVLTAAGEAQTKPAAYSETYQNSWAVVIGIDAYRAAPRLNYSAADAKAVADQLLQLGFPRQNIRLLLDADATKSRIERAFYQDRKEMGPNDRLFVYFAGHGETTPTRTGEEGYILPVDADPDNLPLTAIPMEDIQRVAKRLPAKHYLFVMDACFSGFALTRAATRKEESVASSRAALREPVVQIITAGAKGQRSIEESGHGLFTRRLLEGLRGRADTDAQGFLSAVQLAAWVEDRVARDSRGKMTPQYSKLDGEGNFIFFFSGTGGPRAPGPDLSGTFTGLAQGSISSRPFSLAVTATAVQRGKNFSATWTTGESGGTMAGEVDGQTIRAFRVDQTNPCSATFHGTAIVLDENNAVSGTYSGTDCNGSVSATFRLSRVTREERLGDKPLEPVDLINVGVSYLRQRRHEEALDYFNQALRGAEARGDERNEAQSLGLLGVTLAAQKQYPEAARRFDQSLSLYEKLGDEHLQAVVLLQLGLAYDAQGRPDSARPYYERTLSLAEKVGNEPQMALALYHLGLGAVYQERYSEALAFLDRALPLAERHNMPEKTLISQAREQAASKGRGR